MSQKTFRADSNNYSDNKLRIVICFFGVVARSLIYTWESLEKNLVKPLQEEFNIDIFVFNNNVENAAIDGTRIRNDYKAIPYNYCEEILQRDIDKIIDKLSKKCVIKFHRGYSKETVKNAMRAMYCEYRVGCFLQKNINKYKCAVVCTPDLYLGKPINIADVYTALGDRSSVFTTNNCDCDGYTDSFYIGSLTALVPILKRFESIHNHLPTDKYYEYLLKLYFLKNSVKRKITDMYFCKIRASAYVQTIPWSTKQHLALCNRLKICGNYCVFSFKGIVLRFLRKCKKRLLKQVMKTINSIHNFLNRNNLKPRKQEK